MDLEGERWEAPRNNTLKRKTNKQCEREKKTKSAGGRQEDQVKTPRGGDTMAGAPMVLDHWRKEEEDDEWLRL